jgi:hypothetical protein
VQQEATDEVRAWDRQTLLHVVVGAITPGEGDLGTNV